MKLECNKCAHNFFDVGHEVFECNEAKLGLQVSVFTQMSPRMAEDRVSQSPKSERWKTHLFSARKLS